jgi:predicted porin
MATRAYDVFADGIADNRSIMGGGVNAGASFDGRQNQVVAYVTPKIGGLFTGVIGYVNLDPQLNPGVFASLESTRQSKATSVAGLFDIMPGLTGSLAYEVHNLNAIATGDKETASKLGVGYAQDMFAANLVYEHTNDNLGLLGVNAMGHNDIYLAGKFNLTSSDAIKASYTSAGKINSVANTAAKQFSLGYDHNLSKRTTVYALYTKLSNDSGSAYQLSTASDVGGASSIAAPGASPSAFALGMRHSF